MSKVIEMLKDEHKNILRVIEALLDRCAKDERTGLISADFYRAAIDFIRNYADKFHHAKEEDILFIELNKAAVNLHCNPTEQMLHEHDLGRQFIKELEAGLDENNLAKALAGARGYGNLLKDHIFKEDNILYPLADQALADKVKNGMLLKFEKLAGENLEINKKYELFCLNGTNHGKKQTKKYKQGLS